MTRYANPTIYRCPNCNGYVSYRGFASINLMGMKHWSDGFSSAWLTPTTVKSFGRCPYCRQLFWREAAEEVGSLPRRPHREMEWRSPLTIWILRRIRCLDELEIERMAKWALYPDEWKNAPSIIWPGENDFREMLAISGEISVDREIFLRQRLRWSINDAQRNQTGDEVNPLVKSYSLNSGDRKNLVRLHDLLEAQEKVDLFQMAEIKRELGLFDQAIDILLTIGANNSPAGQKVLALAREGNSRVCLLEDEGF